MVLEQRAIALHHLRRLDDMGFADGLYGQRNTPNGGHGHSGHDYDHDHAHAAPGKEVTDKITASGAVVSPDCDDDCSPKS